VSEPLASARDLDSAASQTSDRRLFAHAIAWDLGSFVSSFERSPADVVDRLWLRRFDEKYARDPSYFLKKRKLVCVLFSSSSSTRGWVRPPRLVALGRRPFGAGERSENRGGFRLNKKGYD
jgi:hypothetical protein